MMKNMNFDDFQKFGQHNMDAAMKVFGEWNKGWQAIAAEMTDYTKRSFEESTATFEKLLVGQVDRAGHRDPERFRQARLRRLHASDVEDRRHVRRARQGGLQAGREGDAGRALTPRPGLPKAGQRDYNASFAITRTVRIEGSCAAIALEPFFCPICSFDKSLPRNSRRLSQRLR